MLTPSTTVYFVQVEAAEEAQTYMIELMENLELRRQERFIGWYHSHPFDVDVNPRYFVQLKSVVH